MNGIVPVLADDRMLSWFRPGCRPHVCPSSPPTGRDGLAVFRVGCSTAQRIPPSANAAHRPGLSTDTVSGRIGPLWVGLAKALEIRSGNLIGFLAFCQFSFLSGSVSTRHRLTLTRDQLRFLGSRRKAILLPMHGGKPASTRWLKRTAATCSRLPTGALGLDRILKHRPFTSVSGCRPCPERIASVWVVVC